MVMPTDIILVPKAKKEQWLTLKHEAVTVLKECHTHFHLESDLFNLYPHPASYTIKTKEKVTLAVSASQGK